jgi:DNA-binding NarL/FixJ family response regulator
VIADDQAIVRSGLGAFIMAYDQLQLVGEAKDGEEAIELCRIVQPDVVLMDVKMPRLDGIGATRIIRQNWPNIHVLVLTSFKDNEVVQGALAAGATGYLLKDLSAEELVEAILQVYEGQTTIAQEATQAIVQAEHIHRLEEEIRTAGANPDQLESVLAAHIPQIFPDSLVQVCAFPFRSVYVHPQDTNSPISDAAWRWLRMSSGPIVYSSASDLPWGGKPAPRTSLAMVPIPALDGGPATGGIGIVVNGDIDDQDEFLRTVTYLARLLAPLLQPVAAQPQQGQTGRAVQELEMAWRIQAGILPAGAPSLRGWDLAARLEPARETSGDFYDFIPLPNNKWALVIADVTDKGLGAAVFMALCSTLIRTYAARYHTLPAIAMSSVNERILSDTRGSLFVTAFYGILEPDIGRLRYVNAGHNPPFLLSSVRGKSVDRLTRTGMPLGISQDATWQQKVAKFAQGDLMVLFTDGVTEAQNRQGVFFGDARLLDVIRRNSGRPAQDIQQAVLDEVQRFTGGAPREDDIALMIISRKG